MVFLIIPEPELKFKKGKIVGGKIIFFATSDL